MQRNVELDLGKWLLCRLMLKEGYSETDIATNMSKEFSARAKNNDKLNSTGIGPTPQDYLQ